MFSWTFSDFAQADIVWDGDTDGVWADASNWADTDDSNNDPASSPGAGQIAYFRNAGNGNTTLDLGAGVSIDQLVFESTSTAAYVIGTAGQNLTLTDNGNTANFHLQSTADADVTIDADILLDGLDTSFDLDSTTQKLVINGDLDTTATVAGSTVRLEFGDFNTSLIGTVDITGNIKNTGGASQLQLWAAGANINLTGQVDQVGAVGANVMKTFIRENGSITVSGTGLLGKGEIDVRYGTLNLNNTTTAQRFENTVTLGDATLANGNATINIDPGATLELATGITYIDDDNTANVGLIDGGTIQITDSSRTFIVHNNALIGASSPELTITSNFVNDGSDRDITIRGADGEAEGGTILLSGTNTSGAITLQAGTLQLGSNSVLDTGGDFLNISARNAGTTVANTTATLDLMGTTNTVNDINLGNDSTTNIIDNGFQINIIDTVGGGALVDANLLRFRNGTGTGIQRNGSATISADIYFDNTGDTKNITLEDGTAVNDMTISGGLYTAAGETDDDFQFIGDGTLFFSGELGNDGTAGGHDRVTFSNRKTTLGSGDIGGTGRVFVVQRNSATYSDFEVELDINGQTVTLNENLVVSNASFGSISTFQNTRISDSAGGGMIILDSATANDLTYNNGGGGSVTAFIEAGIQMASSGSNFSIGDGINDIDVDMSGQLTSDNGTRYLTKSGTGTLRLSNSNNIYGGLGVNAGRLIITNAGALGSDRIQLGNNNTDGTLEYTGSGDTISEEFRIGDNNAGAGRTGSSFLINSGTGGLTFDQANFNQARADVTEARTLTIGGDNTGGENTIAGIIRDNNTGGGGTVALTKTGSNTWNLNGNNIYTGATTVSDGQLNINGTNVSDITVASGAELGGEGSTTGNIVFQGATHTLDINANTAAALGSTGTGSTDVSALNVGGFTININGIGSDPIVVMTYGSGGFIGDVDRFVLGSAPAGSARGGGGTFVDDLGGNITIDFGYADRTWDDGGDGLWNENASTNWVEGDNLFFDSDSVFFNDANTGSFTVALAENVTANNVTFDGTDTANDYTINDNGGGEILEFTGVLTVANGDTATTNDGNDLVLNVTLAGTGSVFIGDGDGIQDATQNSVTISGTNTYSGGTTIDEGRVLITNSAAFGIGTITLQDDGLTGDGTGANRDPIIDLDVDGLSIANDIVVEDVGGAKIIRLDNGGTNTGTIAGQITTRETSRNNFRLEVGGNETLTVSGVITGNGRVATKGVDTATVVLDNAANDFTGALVVGSNVEIGSIANSGVASHAGAGSTIFLGISGGTDANPSGNKRDGNLVYTGSGDSTDRQVQVGNFWFTAGQNHANGGSITNNGTGALVFTNSQFSLQESRVAADIGARTLGLRGTFTGVNEIQGAILDNDATDAFVDETVSVNVDTAGTWALSGANAYTGTTTISSGTLQLGNGGTSGSLSTSSVITNNGTFAVNQTDTVTQGTDFTSTAIGGTGSVVQRGSGTLVLNEANTYAGGTTVEAGTLLVENTSGSGTGTGTVTVNAGATLGGNGFIDGATTISGTHAPGQSVGLQTFNGNLAYDSTATLEWELFSNTESDRGTTGFDAINLVGGGILDLDGTLSLKFDSAGSTVDFVSVFWSQDREWEIFNGAGTLNGVFASLDIGTGSAANGTFAVDYSRGPGSVYLTFTAVPEPTALLMFGMGIGMLGMGRRRRKAK